MAKARVLIVEDEELMRNIVRKLFEDVGFEIFTADSAETALALFSSNNIDVVLTDIKMSGANGLTLLDQIKDISPETAVIVMTAFSSVDTAVDALRKGAYDYITKPFVNEYLIQTIKNAAERSDLTKENRRMRSQLEKRYELSGIIGTSDKMQELFRLVRRVADTTATVLIVGETGTGKELIARALHFTTDRAGSPFLAINCGAIPGSLLESELFGHVKGSFTGATSDNKGLFRSAENGTIFLDEIAEMPHHLQVKLLRALQEKEVTPIGSNKPYRIEARIIAATNKNLETEVAEGRFREDLYYRLNVIQLSVPPLRERRDDIPLLARHFAKDTAIGKDAAVKLISYDWPGNVRELENCIERAMILSSDMINVDDLPPKIVGYSERSIYDASQTLDEVERVHIEGILQSTCGDKTAAAEILGIDLSTLYRKLNRYQANSEST
ncbi:MAG TPA: sigma-54 dependent transcriptional regulator [Pyrinomonadaceae bacterium]|nr:sigma-54 dependent transcriptional regulator [Pyrinomonadaceae bacterium]